MNFSAKRIENVEKKIRTFERVVFDQFLGVNCEISDNGDYYPIKMVDVSREGCQFQFPWDPKTHKAFMDAGEVVLRVYFTKDSFIPLVLNIKHHNEHVEDNGDVFMRYGGSFDGTLPSFQAWETFMKFVYTYSEFSCTNKGEIESLSFYN